MAIYKRGNIYWYKFYFAGRLIRESAKTSSKTIAKAAEKNRRRELEEGYSGLTSDDRAERVQKFSELARRYEEDYRLRHPRSYPRFAKYCLKHLVQHLGHKLAMDITARVIKNYQMARLKEGASEKTINEEVGVLFRILGGWGRFLRTRMREEGGFKLPQKTVEGTALTPQEETQLLRAARQAKSPFIYVAIELVLNTAMRDSEMRHLKWSQIDFFKQILTVGGIQNRCRTRKDGSAQQQADPRSC